MANDYPVRSCALKTVLERARISGHALNKVSKSVFAEILNYCMGVASGDSLIKVADEKVSAVHGGDPKDYTVMEMLPLFKATNDFLDREYPGNRFMTAHFDHSIATAIWCLDGQADKLLDTYHREIAAKGLQTEKMVPALRFSTSDVGMSGANLYSRFSLLKSRSRKTLGDLRITNESYSNLLQLTHNLLKGTIDMEVFLIMPTTPEGKAKLSKELAKFHAEQALKIVQKLPCSTEQKLELIDAVVEHLRSKQ